MNWEFVSKRLWNGTITQEVCDSILQKYQNNIIGVPGVIVKIDGSKFGKRKYHKSRRVDGVWVFGGIERDSKKWFFFYNC